MNKNKIAFVFRHFNSMATDFYEINYEIAKIFNLIFKKM